MDSSLAAILIALIGGSGIAGAVATLLRWRPEKTNILISAAQGAVVVQSSVIDDLNEQMTAMRGQIAALEKEVHDLGDNLRVAKRERDEAIRERDRLKLQLGLT